MGSVRTVYFVAALFAAVSLAQSSTATVVGTIQDSSGGSIAGAAIRVRSVDTDDVRTAQSQPAGEFTVPNLPPGKYEVTIAKTGFRTFRETSLQLEVDQADVQRLESQEISSCRMSMSTSSTAPPSPARSRPA